MKMVVAFLIAVLLGGCITQHGSYRLSVVDANGRDLAPGISMTAEGSHIYSVRNAMCSAHPGATVLIADIQTGQALTSESPYQCRK
ncbi:hypothetical protein [Dyella sp. EPa41]|uniref:hypothetical protein n=1 Tax=Dyella sp. EPa41 TaxID=1561194 RepID=UPI001916154E|nr:hypothetical protein [Dyella sp. EPa41]